MGDLQVCFGAYLGLFRSLGCFAGLGWLSGWGDYPPSVGGPAWKPHRNQEGAGPVPGQGRFT